MKITVLTIINNDNYQESMVTLLSILEQRNWDEQYEIIFLEGNIKKRNLKIISNFFKKKAKITFLECKEIKTEDDIKNFDLRKIKEISESLIYVQSNVLVRKNIAYLFDKYNGEIAAGKKCVRNELIEGNNNEPYDLGLIIIHMNNISDDIYCIDHIIKNNKMQNIDLEDYFYIHPMISLKEVNYYFNVAYKNLDMVEASSASVKLYSSLETRFRENSVISKEWKAYWNETSCNSKPNNNYDNARVEYHGIYSKKISENEVSFCIRKIVLLDKKVCGSEYVIRFLGIPFIRKKTCGFYLNKYFLFLRIERDINWGYIDQILNHNINELAKTILDVNENFVKNYKTKENVIASDEKIDSVELLRKVNELPLYNVFRRVQKDSMELEKEIHLGDVYIEELGEQL